MLTFFICIDLFFSKFYFILFKFYVLISFNGTSKYVLLETKLFNFSNDSIFKLFYSGARRGGRDGGGRQLARLRF